MVPAIIWTKGKPVRDGWIDDKLLILRGQRIMLDTNLAKSLHTTTAHIARIAKRYKGSFPRETMFRLSRREITELQRYPMFASIRRRKRTPLAFSMAGVLALSEILHGRYPPGKGSICGRRSDVYSRESILIRRVRYWTPGKKEEFRDRKCFIIPKLEKIPPRKRKKNSDRRR